ncbi:MAG: M48 family metallopeptidase [Bacteroidaceae bacterium]|nr:M48 family metallopeptidase [Bacteroidaceae bacterium]
MLKKSLIAHPQYGNIEITRNPRARRIILRARPNLLCITLPTFATGKDLERALEMYGKKLLAQQDAIQPETIDVAYRIDTPQFAFELQPHNGDKFLIRYNGRHNTLLYPAATNLHSPERQAWIRNVIKMRLRSRAKEILPGRLQQLATQHGFAFSSVSLRDCHTRWGSCSSRGSINLSIYLVLLPDELIDYVLMHELCHTVEMNHSDRFWALLDKACQCDSRTLRQALKKHKCDIL